MKKSNLYTRTGDQGETALVGGSRIAKDHGRLEAYGTLDEFSAALGFILSSEECKAPVNDELQKIQNMLFNLGCYLATPGSDPQNDDGVPGLTEDHIIELEGWIDRLDNELPPLNCFILPGGTEAASRAHLARTICRRAERRIITLSREEYVAPILISYMNRLSDYLFALARWFNFKAGVSEPKWQK